MSARKHPRWIICRRNGMWHVADRLKMRVVCYFPSGAAAIDAFAHNGMVPVSRESLQRKLR